MNRWTNVRKPQNGHKPPHKARTREADYLPGPFPWTEAQGRACFAAHAWAGGAALGMALMMASRTDRPPCWPPFDVVDEETALLVLLNTASRIRRARINAKQEVEA